MARSCSLDPQLACDVRYAAVRTGAFRYSSTLRGWLFTDDARREVSDATRAKLADRGEVAPYQKGKGPPVAYTTCPFCGGDLPTELTSIRRLIGQGDGEE